MGVYWMIMMINRKIVLEKELYSKNWQYNIPRSTEAIVLLDIMQVVKQKAVSIEDRAIVIVIDNKVVQKMAYRLIEIVNYFNQDSATECIAIKRLKEEAIIDINIDRVYSYRELKTIFQ